MKREPECSERVRDWVMAALRKGHVLAAYDLARPGDHPLDRVDVFAATDGVHHNGPRCVRCGHMWCMWCTDASEIRECTANNEPRPVDLAQVETWTGRAVIPSKDVGFSLVPDRNTAERMERERKAKVYSDLEARKPGTEIWD